MRKRINPVPPAAYTASMVAVYAAMCVGTCADWRQGFGNGVCSVVALIGAAMAIGHAVAGSRRGEIYGSALAVLAVSGAFALSAPPSPAWVVWDYSSYAGAVVVCTIRWGYLCRH